MVVFRLNSFSIVLYEEDIVLTMSSFSYMSKMYDYCVNQYFDHYVVRKTCFLQRLYFFTRKYAHTHTHSYRLMNVNFSSKKTSLKEPLVRIFFSFVHLQFLFFSSLDRNKTKQLYREKKTDRSLFFLFCFSFFFYQHIHTLQIVVRNFNIF